MKQTAQTSFKWSFVIQATIQVTQFVVSIVLARILFPKDFGLIGMVGIFIAIGKTITDGGFGQSLIRTKHPEADDYSTVFLFSMVTSILFYVILYFSAPWVATFFGEPILISVLRVYGIAILVSALSTIQSIKLNKELKFKTQFKLLLPSMLISSAIAIWMAYSSYGVWSLVAKELVFSILATIQLWIYSKWSPRLIFSSEKFKKHFTFSSNLLLTELFKRVFANGFDIVIGKLYSAAQLGLFTRAKSISYLPGGFLFSAVNRVMYPLLADRSSTDKELKQNVRRIFSLLAFVLVPTLFVLIFFGESIIILLLTAKWIDALPYLQLLTLAAILEPFQQLQLNIFKVKGQSSVILRIAIAEYALIVLGIVATSTLGVMPMVVSLIAVVVIKYIITAVVSGKQINYSYKEQFEDLFMPFIFSVLSGLAVYFSFEYINLTAMEYLLCGVVPFAALYFLLGYIFKSDAQKNLILLAKQNFIK